MTKAMINNDSEDFGTPIALLGSIVGNPPHVSLTIGEKYPQVSLRDYLLVSRAQIKRVFCAAQILVAEQSPAYVTLTDLTCVPTTSTILIDSWYGAALLGDIATSAQGIFQSTKREPKRISSKDEGLFFDPDDFVER